MTKLITAITIPLLFLALCSSENHKDLSERMRQYEYQTKSFRDKANKIENDSLKRELFGIAMWLFNQEMMEIKKQIEPNTKYIDNPYFILESNNSYKDLTANYINGLILFYFNKSGNKYEINTSEAFKYPFKINTTWQEAIFDNLKTYPFAPKDNNNDLQSNDIQVIESGKWSFPKSFEITYPTKEKTPIPTKIKAEILAEMPSKIHQFHFLKADIGKTQTKNNLSVTLLNIKNSYVDIEVTTPEGFIANEEACEQYNWLKINAKDNTSQYISMSNTSNHKWTNNAILGDLYQAITDKETFTLAFLSNFLEKANKVFEDEKSLNEKRDKNKHYRFQLFKGVVEEINVDIYDYSTPEIIRKEVIYPISDFRNLISLGDFKEINTTSTVYDIENTMLSNKPYDFSENDLENHIKTNQMPALMSKGSVVEFEYPNLVSSRIIGKFKRFNKIKEFSFLSKNENPIDISLDSINYNSFEKRGSMVNVFARSIEYFPKRFPEIPYYVKGIIEVNMADVKKQTYSIDNLPEGVYIKDNAVLLEQNLYEMKEYLVLVKDSTNRYLKQINEYSGAVDINGKKSNKHIRYYYGTPQIIEVYTVSDTKTIDYNFKVKLTREESNEYTTIWN